MKPVSIRFSKGERRAIERAAARDKLPFGSWTRQIAVLAAQKGLRVKRSVVETSALSIPRRASAAA